MKSGFFVTCLKNKQSESYREISSILDIEFDLAGADVKEKESDLKSIFQNEKKKIKRFALETFKGIPNIYFIKEKVKFINNEQDVSKITEIVKSSKLRYTCNVNYLNYFGQYGDFKEEDLANFLDRQNFQGSSTFKISFKQRCSDLDIKTRIFEIVLEKFPNLKVNLKKPDVIVIFQVIKCFIGFGITKM